MLHFKRNRILEGHGEYIETASWKAAVEKRLSQNIWKKDKRKTYHRKKKKQNL